MNKAIDRFLNSHIAGQTTFDGTPWVQLFIVAAVLWWMLWVTLSIKLPKQQ